MAVVELVPKLPLGDPGPGSSKNEAKMKEKVAQRWTGSEPLDPVIPEARQTSPQTSQLHGLVNDQFSPTGLTGVRKCLASLVTVVIASLSRACCFLTLVYSSSLPCCWLRWASRLPGEATQAQRGEAICPKAHSQSGQSGVSSVAVGLQSHCCRRPALGVVQCRLPQTGKFVTGPVGEGREDSRGRVLGWLDIRRWSCHFMWEGEVGREAPLRQAEGQVVCPQGRLVQPPWRTVWRHQ